MTALEKPVLTAEAYLEAERAADFKSEYVNGEVFAMSGAKLNHNRIASNAIGEIGNQLKERPGEVLGSDMKVRVDSANAFFYPDVSGLCGPFEFYDDREDVYTNPQFIIEILSDSTQAYDRGDKFFHYQTLPSLREYILISQTSVAVEVYRKQNEDWLYRLHRNPDDMLKLDSVGCSVPLQEIYRNVKFPAKMVG